MTNRFDAQCYVCHLPVKAGEGVLRRDAKQGWTVRHTMTGTRGSGECDNGQPARTKYRAVIYPWQVQ